MMLRHLRYFVAVAESKSLSAAADVLHIAQPALTHNIKNLEDVLGVKLFTRSKKGMCLTDNGRLFLSHAQAILRQVNIAKQCVRDSFYNPKGVVYLAMPSSVSNAIVVYIFREIRNRYPDIELSLHEGLTGEMDTLLKKGKADILINFDVDESAEYIVEPLLRESLYFIQSYKVDTIPTITFKELTEYPIYLPKSAVHGMRRSIMQYAKQENLKLEISSNAPTMHAMIQLVENGLGYGVLPWSAIHNRIEKKLSVQKITEPELFRKVAMITDITKPKTNAVATVMLLIREATKIANLEGSWHGELLF
jgi:LysR family nitrogen assimilation transcriptional regulator